MKANFKKTLKHLKNSRNVLQFYNDTIGHSVSNSKRLSEESTDKYLGANWELYDLIQQIEKVENKIKQTIN